MNTYRIVNSTGKIFNPPKQHIRHLMTNYNKSLKMLSFFTVTEEDNLLTEIDQMKNKC